MSPIERSGGGGGGTASPLTTKGDVYTFSTVNARLPVGTDHQVLTANSGATTGNDWETPPGFEINYTQITSGVNITSTTEATGTTIISPGAITFDGGPVMVQFFSAQVTCPTPAGSFVTASLFEGSTQITELFTFRVPTGPPGSLVQAAGFYRFTPTAGSHTYTVTAFATSTTGTPAIGAGAGGTGANPPSFVRFTKV